MSSRVISELLSEARALQLGRHGPRAKANSEFGRRFELDYGGLPPAIVPLPGRHFARSVF
jgi:hypothetical protein